MLLQGNPAGDDGGFASHVLDHNPLVGYVAELAGVSVATAEKLLLSLFLLIIVPLLNSLILRVVRSSVKDSTSVYRARVALRYFSGISVLILLVAIWFGSIADLGTYISIISAGLVIALQDSVANMAGFVFVMWRRPFSVQDRIEIDGLRGDVIDIRLFQFTIVEVGNWVDADQSTGRIVHIPNRKVFTEALANYTAGFEYIWNEIPVVVTFESNWRLAKELLTGIAQRHCEQFSPEAESQIRSTAQRYMIIAGKLTPIVYTRVVDIGVELTLRYLTHARRRRGTSQELWEAILDEFAQHPDIDYAYPTTRFYDNRREGKPEAGGTHRDPGPGTGDQE
ncbi:MAG: mechanosensitive ion channel [bacterium]